MFWFFFFPLACQSLSCLKGFGAWGRYLETGKLQTCQARMGMWEIQGVPLFPSVLWNSLEFWFWVFVSMSNLILRCWGMRGGGGSCVCAAGRRGCSEEGSLISVFQRQRRCVYSIIFIIVIWSGLGFICCINTGVSLQCKLYTDILFTL